MGVRNSSLLRLILSMLIYGTIGIFRKAIPVSSAFLAMFRGFCGAFLLLLFLAATRRKPEWNAVRKKLVPLIVSGGIIGLNWILLFESYRYTTVAISTLCYYMSPVFVMIASPFLLHQPLEKRKVISLVLSLIGMLLITGVFSPGVAESGRMIGILLGLGAAALYATVILINQTLGNVPSFERTIVQLFSAGVVVLPYTVITGGMATLSFNPGHLALLLLIGLVHTAIAYVLYFSSMDHLSAQTVAIISYLDPLTAVLMSAFLLHEPIDALGILGTVFILAAAVYAEIDFHFPGKQNKQEVI